MRIRLLTDNGLIDLKKASEEHPEYYINLDPNPDDFDCFEYPDFQIPADNYPDLILPLDGDEGFNENDYLNSLILYKFFSLNRIPLSLLFDPRYLSYLTHFVYINYMRLRWPTEGIKSKGRIPDRYFFKRAPYGRQGILGLFWPAYLLSLDTDEPKVFKERLHYYFCGNRILRDSVIEHSYARNPKLFSTIMEDIAKNDGTVIRLTGKKGKAYPKVIQNMLSVTSLDLLENDELTEMLDEQVKIIAAGAYDDAADDDIDDE